MTDSGRISDRKCFKIGDGLYRMDQSIQALGRNEGYDATGPYWVVGLIKIYSGSTSFIVDGHEVQAPSSSFVMAMPAHSVVTALVNDVRTFNSAVFSRTLPLKNLPTQPIAFATNRDSPFQNRTDIEEALVSANHIVPISRTTSPHPASAKIKDFIGEHFSEEISLLDLADRGDLTPEVLSRIFKRDWGKPPIHFRNWLRIIDSFRHISENHAIIDTAYDVGFNDLTRFHKQFKKTVGYTPLSIRTRSKNAKF